MKKVALIIIYNHRYDNNIEILEKIYQVRFSNIYHLVPFYDGDKSNVIPVYESSFYFQGYVAQGFKHFFNEKYDHYIFVADDLILNPIISEKNYSECLDLTDSASFIPGFISLHNQPLNRYWPRVGEAFHYNIRSKGVEASKEIPSYVEAIEAFSRFGLEIKPLHFDQIYDRQIIPSKIYHINDTINYLKWFIGRCTSKIVKKSFYLPYPTVGSYSDIFVVSSQTMKRFVHYCGVFAATNLFAEVAIPTALVLSAQNIVTEKDLKLQGKALWPDGWNRLNGDTNLAKGDYEELEQYHYKLELLLDNFPDNYLYLHPIKLSKWNNKF